MIRTTACRCVRKSLQRWGVDMNMDRIKYRYWEREVWDDPTSPLVAKHTDIVAGCDPTVAVSDFEFCTGLKDKNGNLIYEGDILTDGKDEGHVFWKEDVGAWGITAFLFKYKPNELEIIGNIHEQKDNK